MLLQFLIGLHPGFDRARLVTAGATIGDVTVADESSVAIFIAIFMSHIVCLDVFGFIRIALFSLLAVTSIILDAVTVVVVVFFTVVATYQHTFQFFRYSILFNLRCGSDIGPIVAIVGVGVGVGITLCLLFEWFELKLFPFLFVTLFHLFCVVFLCLYFRFPVTVGSLGDRILTKKEMNR